MQTILQALAPHLLELIAAILTLIIGWLAARSPVEVRDTNPEALKRKETSSSTSQAASAAGTRLPLVQRHSAS